MLILASASPRRQELLQLITTEFEIHTKDTDESLPEGIAPVDAVQQLALRKALAVAQDFPHDIVIGADTVVAVDNRLLGKPKDAQDAAAMLQLLSGRRHFVYTGVALIYPAGQQVFYQQTGVDFTILSPEEIARYVKTGEPMDKAGAYGIQGLGALLIEGIQGDYYNVMGLPVSALNKALGTLKQGNVEKL